MEKKSDNHILFDILKLFGIIFLYVILISCIQLAALYLLRKQFSVNFFEELSTKECLLMTVLNTFVTTGIFFYKTKDLGLKPVFATINKGLLLRFVVLGVLTSMGVIALIAVLLFWDQPYSMALNPGFSMLELCAFMVLFVIAAFNEELLCRGILLEFLLKNNSAWLSVFISASMFTLLHLGNPGFNMIAFLNIFFAGVVLGQLYLYSGRSIYLPVIFHAGWNFFQGPFLGFAVSGFKFSNTLFIINSPFESSTIRFGLEGSIACTYVSLAVTAVLAARLYSIKRKISDVVV